MAKKTRTAARTKPVADEPATRSVNGVHRDATTQPHKKVTSPPAGLLPGLFNNVVEPDGRIAGFAFKLTTVLREREGLLAGIASRNDGVASEEYLEFEQTSLSTAGLHSIDELMRKIVDDAGGVAAFAKKYRDIGADQTIQKALQANFAMRTADRSSDTKKASTKKLPRNDMTRKLILELAKPKNQKREIADVAQDILPDATPKEPAAAMKAEQRYRNY
ncbi:MAG: hypothetical protein K8U03_03070 [Planctomycetia bacterium]|nr:hypothetical protein [Planctomycetia bacterium]